MFARFASARFTFGTRGFALQLADLSFRAVDWDRDGRISFEEYSANRTQILRRGFVFLDRDRDGTIGPREYARVTVHAYQAGSPPPDAASFAELDRNRDRRVSWVEFTT